MQIICEATQSENSQIKVSALQNLVKIMNLYYEFMEAYMGQALFAVSSCLNFSFIPDLNISVIFEDFSSSHESNERRRRIARY